MNNEQEIEEMAKVLFESGVALDATDFAFGVDGDDHFTRLAIKIVNAGNVKQAVKEFAERLKKEIIEGGGTCLDEYDIGKQDGYNSACEHHRQAIEDLITELYGADE